MALTDKREEAEKLYVKNGMACPAIAEKLGVNEGTVYRWKSESASKGESVDWDTQRRIYNLSPLEMFAAYAETVKAWIVNIQKNPELLADPKIADAIVKHVSVLQKLDKRSQYKGVALDLIKIVNRWLAENQPRLKEALGPCWEAIYQELVKYYTDTGMFECGK
jgi:transposase-like protein